MLTRVHVILWCRCKQICDVLGYDADQTKAICGPDWWCTCASGVLWLRYHPHNLFCRRPVYDYTKFLYLPLETLGLASVADVKFLHLLYWPTIIKDGRFVAVVVYAKGRDLKGDKKTEDLVFYLRVLAPRLLTGSSSLTVHPSCRSWIELAARRLF